VISSLSEAQRAARAAGLAAPLLKILAGDVPAFMKHEWVVPRFWFEVAPDYCARVGCPVSVIPIWETNLDHMTGYVPDTGAYIRCNYDAFGEDFRPFGWNYQACAGYALLEAVESGASDSDLAELASFLEFHYLEALLPLLTREREQDEVLLLLAGIDGPGKERPS